MISCVFFYLCKKIMINFTINKKLPTLNEYIAKERENKYAAANLKAQTQNDIEFLILSQKVKFEPKTAYYVLIEWYNYRQDPDNVEFSQKFIFDTLQNMKLIENDNDKIIKHKAHLHLKDKNSKYAYQVVIFFKEKTEFLNYLNQNI